LATGCPQAGCLRRQRRRRGRAVPRKQGPAVVCGPASAFCRCVSPPSPRVHRLCSPTICMLAANADVVKIAPEFQVQVAGRAWAELCLPWFAGCGGRCWTMIATTATMLTLQQLSRRPRQAPDGMRCLALGTGSTVSAFLSATNSVSPARSAFDSAARPFDRSHCRPARGRLRSAAQQLRWQHLPGPIRGCLGIISMFPNDSACWSPCPLLMICHEYVGGRERRFFFEEDSTAANYGSVVIADARSGEIDKGLKRRTA
jgi:hypothetical protein